MAITEIKNLDFILYTEKSLHIETIKFRIRYGYLV